MKTRPVVAYLLVIRLFLCLISFSLLSPIAHSQEIDRKYSRVRIFITKEFVHELQKLGLDFDHSYFDEQNPSIITSLHQEDIALLQSARYKYKVEIEDEVADFLAKSKVSDFYKNDKPEDRRETNASLLFDSPSENVASTIVTPAAFTPGSMGGYYTLTEMNQKIDDMAANYPNLVHLSTIGSSYFNRPVRVIKISDNPSVDESEPEILFTGMHHSREPLAMMNLIFFMQYLLENYSSNARIKELVDSRELFFIPCINPDGYQHNCTTNPNGGGMWRKTRKPNGDGTTGVDLNRNYGLDFGYNNVGSSATPSSDAYRGPSAFSEIESQNMRNYVRTRNFTMILNYHSYGGYWINSFSVPARTLPAADALFARTAGQFMTKHNIYHVGTPSQTVGYEANGSSDDWFLAGDEANIGRIPCFSPEVGLGLSTFWPPAATIIPYCKEVMHSNLQAALIGGSYTKIENTTPISVNSNLSGNFSYTIRRIGRLDSSVRVSVIPLENILTVGPEVTVNSLPGYLSTSNGSFPYTLRNTISDGQRIRFVYRVVTGGVTQYDTVTTYYSADTAFHDNMETGLATSRWTISSGWAYTTINAYSGTRSLTESPSGAYSNSVTQNATTPFINLTNATAAHASFWIRYTTQKGHDRLHVQLASSANGNVFADVAGANTIRENIGSMGNRPGYTGLQEFWVRETINLRDHLGSSNVRLRFSFVSNASVNADGIYLDDVVVVRTNAMMLPLNFLQFSGHVRNNSEVFLSWVTDEDDAHDYFMIERSKDGILFEPIGKLQTKPPYRFTDKQPVSGVNYYRIQQVDKDGKYKYSKVISVRLTNIVVSQVFPNPASTRINVELTGNEAEEMRFELLDNSGRLMKQKNVHVQGTTRIEFDLTDLSNQLYYIKIHNSRNELVRILNFVKK